MSGAFRKCLLIAACSAGLAACTAVPTMSGELVGADARTTIS